ncbi:MAG: copper-binding protein [Agitococcus sp.]|nr:copper-binding protein [Agitococcus sp.]
MTFSVQNVLPRLILMTTSLIMVVASVASDTADPKDPQAPVPVIIYSNPYDDFRAVNETPKEWKKLFNVADKSNNQEPVNPIKTAQTLDNTDAKGTIIAIQPENGTIKIKHGEIKKLDMSAMTMTYKVANSDVLQGLRVGDNVGFDVQEQGSDYVVMAIRKEP